MQIKGIKVEWTQTFEHHCIYLLRKLRSDEKNFIGI